MKVEFSLDAAQAWLQRTFTDRRGVRRAWRR